MEKPFAKSLSETQVATLHRNQMGAYYLIIKDRGVTIAHLALTEAGTNIVAFADN